MASLSINEDAKAMSVDASTSPTISPAHPDSPKPDPDLASPREVWSGLKAVTSVVVKVLVDNETDGLSAPCACCDPSLDPSTRTPYQSEFTTNVQEVLAGHRPCFDFTRTLQAAHGLSLLVEVTIGGEGPDFGKVHRVLFDGGPSAELWAANAKRLGLDMAGVEAAVLSHWHVDHSVGLLAVAAAASRAREQPDHTLRPDEGALADFVIDVHPKRPVRRGLQLSVGGRPVPFNEDPTCDALSLPGCRVEKHAGPHSLMDCFFVSGAIPRVTSFETGQPGHVTLGADGMWRPDPFIMEERYLALKLEGHGAVVFSGCSHAGIINVLTDAQQVSGGPVYAVMGGLHLAGRLMELRIADTIAAMQKLQPHLVLTGHCTGWKAKAALAAAFPDGYQPISVGGTYRFLGGLGATEEQSDEQRGGAAERWVPPAEDSGEYSIVLRQEVS